jgi:hypothetical protein
LDKYDLARYVLNFEFKNPENFKFDLVGYFNQQKLNQGILREYNKSKAEAKSIISSWINEGIERVVVIYDTLGNITLNFDINHFQDELTIDNNFITPGLLLSLYRVNEQPDTTFSIEKELFTNVFAFFNRDIFTVSKPSELSDLDVELYIRNTDIDINAKTNDNVIDKIYSHIGDIGEPGIRGRIRHILNRMKGVDFVGIKVFDYHTQKRLTPKLGIYSDKAQLKLIKDNNDVGFVFINKDDLLIDIEGRFNKETIIEKNKTKTEAM